MERNERTNKFRLISKRKLIVGALLVGAVLLLVLLIVGAIAIAIIAALFGQADASVGQAVSGAIASLRNYATELINTTVQQIITNPLQSLNGSAD